MNCLPDWSECTDGFLKEALVNITRAIEEGQDKWGELAASLSDIEAEILKRDT